jgi:hypothetical protein
MIFIYSSWLFTYEIAKRPPRDENYLWWQITEKLIHNGCDWMLYLYGTEIIFPFNVTQDNII